MLNTIQTAPLQPARISTVGLFVGSVETPYEHTLLRAENLWQPARLLIGKTFIQRQTRWRVYSSYTNAILLSSLKRRGRC
jgi:hypothetical protein